MQTCGPIKHMFVPNFDAVLIQIFILAGEAIFAMFDLEVQRIA